jgi:stage II sporulation SpoE-like protein/MASE1 protein
VWWLGDMGGDLLVAPALMVAATHWPFDRVPGRASEAAVLAATIVGASVVIFSQATNLAYLVFPLLIWAAVRFCQPGAAAASLAVAGIAVAFTAQESGPFVRSNPDDSLLLAQTFFGVSGITVLLLAAVITERRRAEAAVEDIARTLQESLLPTVVPDIPGVEAAVRYRPAGARYRVGGDFYDIYDAADGSWAIAVGDVCGKGAEAAAVTALARYTLRAVAMHERCPSRILALLNEAMLRQGRDEMFCAVSYLRLDVRGSGAELTFSTGGLPLPLLLRRSAGVETIGRPGMLLGVEPDPGFPDYTVNLQAGDAVMVYTDGLTDAYAPTRTLDVPKLGAMLETCHGLGAQEIAAHIEAAVLDLDAAEPRDDIAFVVLRLRPDHEHRMQDSLPSG